jgi:hypothetical protein
LNAVATKILGTRVDIRLHIPKFIQADFIPNPALILFGLIAPRAIKGCRRSTTEVTDETVRTDETVTEASD